MQATVESLQNTSSLLEHLLISRWTCRNWTVCQIGCHCHYRETQSTRDPLSTKVSSWHAHLAMQARKVTAHAAEQDA